MRTLLKQVLRVSFVTFASVNYKSQIKLNELHLPSPYVRAAPGSEEAWIRGEDQTHITDMAEEIWADYLFI